MVKVKVKFNLEQATKAHRGSRSSILSLTSALDGVDGQCHAPAALPSGKRPGSHLVATLQEAGWAPGPVWIGAENLASTGIPFPDRPARSESLYRLSYPGQQLLDIILGK